MFKSDPKLTERTLMPQDTVKYHQKAHELQKPLGNVQKFEKHLKKVRKHKIVQKSKNPKSFEKSESPKSAIIDSRDCKNLHRSRFNIGRKINDISLTFS